MPSLRAPNRTPSASEGPFDRLWRLPGRSLALPVLLGSLRRITGGINTGTPAPIIQSTYSVGANSCTSEPPRPMLMGAAAVGRDGGPIYVRFRGALPC